MSTPSVVHEVSPEVAAPPDTALIKRYPSIAFYPAVDAPLREALEHGADPREVLAALAASMAPHRWPSMDDWDRHGFIALEGPVTGHVSRVAGELVRQTPGRHDLGCAGGFLEGVRLTLLPRLGVDELDRCEATAKPVEGGPAGCDPDREYGWLALANIAARLDETQLAGGARLVEIDATKDEQLATLAAANAMHLCTVSHVSGTYARSRFYHHMMIVLGTEDGKSVELFDTTGGRGVSLTTMTGERFVRYVTVLLRMNREFRYLGGSTGLTCLPVKRARPRGSTPG